MRILLTSLFSSALFSSALLTAQGAPNLKLIGTSTPPFEVAESSVLDLTGDGSDDLLILGAGGEVRSLDPSSGEMKGTLVLPHPRHSLVAVAALNGDEVRHLIVFSPDGLHAHAWKGAGFVKQRTRLLRRGRFSLRVGKPRLSEIVQDVNGDGRPDLVLPGNTDCTLYLNTASTASTAGTADGDGALPKFIKASRLQLRVSSSSSTTSEPLSRDLSHSITIPNLRTLDVNGDKRADLLAEVGTRRLFHLQRKNGAFSTDPDVTLDLTRFRDTTPKAGIELGETLAQDNALLHMQDLDGDEIPDFIIAHRRKVWVYHGTDKGPQFDTPSKILILAEDVTFLLLLHLDDDSFPDLLTFKLQIPTLATLFLGLFSSWDVRIKSAGYQSLGGKTFARRPRWKSETVLRVPSIMSLISNPESITEKFTDVGKKFRHAVTGDLDGDGDKDVLMQTEDQKLLQIWLMPSETADSATAGDKQVRALLFEDANRVWDVDRILQFVKSMADDRNTRLTAGRPAAGEYRLRDPAKFRLASAAVADFDGDGRREVVLHYVDLDAPHRSALDILRLRP